VGHGVRLDRPRTVVTSVVTEGTDGVEPKPNPGSGVTGRSSPSGLPRQVPCIRSTRCRSVAP
jgi:hypothetical protein